MSERPTQCKFCGNSSSVLISGLLTFRCSSEWCPESETWVQRSACELAVLRARIGRAVEQLKDAPRYFTVSAWNGDLLIRRHMKGGEFTESEVLVTVLKILSEDAGAKHEQA